MLDDFCAEITNGDHKMSDQMSRNTFFQKIFLGFVQGFLWKHLLGLLPDFFFFFDSLIEFLK